jgi:hypothetical protein
LPTVPTLLYNTDTPTLFYPTQFHARSILSMFDSSRTHAVTYYAFRLRHHSHEHGHWIILQVCTEQHVNITDTTHSHAHPHSKPLTRARAHAHTLTQTFIFNSDISVLFYSCPQAKADSSYVLELRIEI